MFGSASPENSTFIMSRADLAEAQDQDSLSTTFFGLTFSNDYRYT